MGPIPADSPRLFPSSNDQASSDDPESLFDARYHGGINNEDVALVVSLEMDSYGQGLGDGRWRDYEFARALQFVQWTIMASPLLSVSSVW